MTIHRVGNGGAPPVPPETTTTRTGGAATTPFHVERGAVERGAVERAQTNAPATVSEVKPSAALEGVRNGSLDVKGYVDAKVVESTQHLSHLTPSQLASVQGVVRQQLLADPHLRELVEQATGHAVPKDED